MKILLVEDEQKAAKHIKLGLTENGFVVDHTDNGQDALFLFAEYYYSLIILDIMLPKIDGLSVLKKIRTSNASIPVLILTARDSLDDKVMGLNLGADDYLAKPFAFSELLARVYALLRRGKQPQKDTIKIADIEVDVLKHKVRRDGQRIMLSPKEFALLCLLIKRQGQVLSRLIIAESVWDMNFDSDTNIVDVAIKRLRDKLNAGKKPNLIHTIRGVGYVFEETVK